ncbi:MAG: uroporphyrinogen-III C-methyltransferase [Rhizobiales bacterium]|nr:uroporphyrinogen-III C-methyltransferase [Hyphomicrobiales bacterium]
MSRGRIDLVGAGPGDPELLTLKALRCLEQAEVVVYDRLVSPEIMALAPVGATRISVGKSAGNHTLPQMEINDLLIRLAVAGHRVVRLKGGDPFIFGRGSEEALELAQRNISFDIIPGITAAQGCAAAAKIPLTHRGLSTGARYITGHCRNEEELDFDWAGLADPQTTLAVYMGRAHIAEITSKLMAHGLAADTPAIAIWRGTTAKQVELISTLERLAEDTAVVEFDGPLLFFIGKVVGLARVLNQSTTPMQERSDAAAIG